MNAPFLLTPLNNQWVEIDGLLDGTTKYLQDGVTLNPNPSYLNSATGTYSIKDPSGTTVAGPITMTYVSGSNGDYRGLLTSSFNPPVGDGYTIVLDLTQSGGFVGHWEIPARVVVRKT